jgi:uncharacterized repeat protein (TIGR03803 family)
LKSCVKNLFLLLALTIGLGLILAGRVTAQTFTTLHTFTAVIQLYGTNSDGAFPYDGLILSGNTLYGTAAGGGGSGRGAMFAVNADGTGFTNIYTFTGIDPNTGTNSDGANPTAGLILSGNTLYGTARNGGSYTNGTVFAVNTDGTGFTNLHNFTSNFRRVGSTTYRTNSDGASPQGGLILSGNTLYGTATGGGTSGNGTVFAVNTNGTGFTNLHSFTATNGPSYFGTNSDGANPIAGLILSGNILYGTAFRGGTNGSGTVFAINTDSTGFTNLYSFTAIASPYYPNDTNSDGANPIAGLILSGDTLYGTALHGGSAGEGTVFKLNTDGTGFTNLHNFAGYPSDGANPEARLILSGNTLYGTAAEGGSSFSPFTGGSGTLFAVNTDGTGFTTLHSFTAPSFSSYPYTNSDGYAPLAGLILSGNTLYGTAVQGGSSGDGTVFSISFTPQLKIIPSGANVILTWPTNVAGFDYTGFTLQSTTNLVPPAVWSTNSPPPVVVNGQNTVTNPISGTQQFFRLSQQ